MLGIQIRDDQLQRPQVVTGDPACAVRIQHVGPVPQPQRGLAVAARSAHPQHGVLRKVVVAAGRIEPGRIEPVGSSPLDQAQSRRTLR